MARKSITIVVPVFCEASGLQTFFDRLASVVDQRLARYDISVIFVNDGSTDNSLSILEGFASSDHRIGVVDLSRNFGKEAALSAGVEVAAGDAVICMDADLQHPPECLPEFLERWENGAEIVVGVRSANAATGPIRKHLGAIFYALAGALGGSAMKKDSTDFCLIDQKAVGAVITVGDTFRVFRYVVDWVGFKRDWVYFSAPARKEGRTSFSARKLFDLAMTALISSSQTPLKLIGVIGLLVTIFAVSIGSLVLVDKLFLGDQLKVTPLGSFTILNTFMTGLVLSVLGLMSLYIAKIQAETQHRPLYIIRRFVKPSRIHS